MKCTAFLCGFDYGKYLCVVSFLEYSFLRFEGKQWLTILKDEETRGCYQLQRLKVWL